MKRSFVGALLGFAVCLVCLLPIYADLVLQGRDIIEPDAKGADLLAAGGGEDLLYGANWTARKYPFVQSAVALRGVSTSATDAGYLWVRCLDASGRSTQDSVLIAGITEQTFSGPCASVLGVNEAGFHDDSTNVGVIRIYHGAGQYTNMDSILASIDLRQRRASMAVYKLPAGQSQLTVYDWQITPTTVFSGAPSPAKATTRDSIAVGRVALLARKPGQAWEELLGFNFRTNAGPIFFQPSQPAVFDLAGLTELAVPAGVTGAATDLTSRMRIGIY